MPKTYMKQKVFISAILLMALAIPQSVKAYSFSAVAPSGQTLYYNIVNGNAQVTYQNSSYPRYSSLSGSLTVPDTVTYNGTTYLVTSIGSQAFEGCSGLTSVSIPNSVNSIGDCAFINCSGLTSMNIPDSVTSISESTFEDCSGLTSVTIPNAVTSIGNYAFSGCRGLTSITIPNSVTNIGTYAFRNCSGLTTVTIPNSVTNIGYEAFGGSGLTTVNFNANCTYMGSNGHSPFLYCANLTTLNIGNNVTRIPRYAFQGCSGLTSVTIPNSVTIIDQSAFQNCRGLTSITLSDSLTEIQIEVFKNCTSLTSVTIPNSVTSIGDGAFQNCSGLTTVNFNATNCTSMSGPSGSVITPVFDGCTSLTTLNIGNNVTRIPRHAFQGCSSLPTVTIPSSVTSIGYRAFRFVRHIEYHGTATGSPWAALSMNGFIEGDFIYSDSTKTTLCSYIGAGGAVTIPVTVTSIGDQAFEGCRGVTSVTIGNSVTSIGEYAFEGCSGLTSVTIGDSVTSIGNYAFNNCSGLTTTNYTGTLAQWCNINFSNTTSNPAYYSHNLYINGSEVTQLVIPNGVTEIKQYAFYNCSGLTSITLTDSVTSFGNSAFSGCSGLTMTNYTGTLAQWCNINFSGTESNPVYYSRNLYINGTEVTQLEIPNGVTEIKQCIFCNCTSLTSITIPSSVTSIGNSAFYCCSGLTSITCLASVVPTIGTNVFSGVSAIVYIPCGRKQSYLSRWPYLRYVETLLFSFNATSADSTTGSVIVLTQPTCQDSAVIEAVPNTGYHFANWSDGDTANPRTLVVACDTTLTAVFAANQYTVTLEVNDTLMGHVTGASTYNYGDTATLYAEAFPGYLFVQWDDGDTSNPRILVVTQDTSIVAFFGEDDDTTGIREAEVNDASRVFAHDGQIVVEGAEGMPVMLYDATGRLLATRKSEEMHGGTPLRLDVPASGVYLVRIGNLPAKRVVVIR